MELELVDVPSEHFLCDRYRAGSLTSSRELIDVYRALKSQQPDVSFLFTLDDLGQACYTSMHAKSSHNLDEIEGFDLSTLGPECFDEGGHKGYLTSKSELFIREANYLRGVRDTSLADVLSKQISPYEVSVDDFVSANENIAGILDEEIYVLAVERPHGYQALYAFPNGYFSCDLNPFETFVMAKHMQEQFGYVLVGIGASRLAFLAEEKLEESGVHRLLSFLRELYACEWDEDMHASAKDCVTRGGLLVLRYTE
jgi:hypothetical protein